MQHGLFTWVKPLFTLIVSLCLESPGPYTSASFKPYSISVPILFIVPSSCSIYTLQLARGYRTNSIRFSVIIQTWNYANFWIWNLELVRDASAFWPFKKAVCLNAGTWQNTDLWIVKVVSRAPVAFFMKSASWNLQAPINFLMK